MRKDASLLIWLACTAIVPSRLFAAADADFPIGKLVPQEINVPVAPLAEKQDTPNQVRRQLGQPIVASFPAPEYGESIETPNQVKQSLGISLQASFPSPEYGIAEETPNHRQERVASAQKLATRR